MDRPIIMQQNWKSQWKVLITAFIRRGKDLLLNSMEKTFLSRSEQIVSKQYYKALDGCTIWFE